MYAPMFIRSLVRVRGGPIPRRTPCCSGRLLREPEVRGA